MYNLLPREITREIMFNVGGPHGFARWFIYIPFIIILIMATYRFYSKIKVWRAGKKDERYDKPIERIKGVIIYACAQAKILRQAFGGVMHVCILWGFVVLTIGTTLIFVQEDFTGLIFGEKGQFLYGSLYLWFSLALDIFGLAAIIGTLMAIFRRYIQRPKQLDNKPTDLYALSLILLILITGFIAEGLRIAMTGFPPFEIWSPIGWVLGKLAYNMGLGLGTMGVIHKLNWWVHFALAMLFIYALTSGKLMHIITSTANIFFRQLGPKAELQIIPPKSFETAESFGVSRVEQFTWKQLFDGDACTRCGRCEDACPAANTDKPLSPKKIIQDANDNLYTNIRQIFLNKEDGRIPLIGNSIKEDELWSCTNCMACQEECPVLIEHVQKITDMRRHLVLMEGKMDESAQNTFKNIETNGNPYGIGFSSRGDWAKGLGIKTLAEDPNVDYVYFVGCAGSFDDRNKQVAKAFVKILLKAGISVGILGEEETCCGDSALRMGNEYLFQMLAQQNIGNFNKYNVKKIVTTCPHGYNILKKEYRQFGADLNVIHHTELINNLINNGKIKISAKNNKGVQDITYHDSCFLGRYNDIYDAPRMVLRNIPNTNLIEMGNHHSKSLCCGGGGGRMWLEEKLGTRINHKRLEDVQGSGAKTVASACPFCLTMLYDATKEKNVEEKYQVKDVAEILAESVE